MRCQPCRGTRRVATTDAQDEQRGIAALSGSLQSSIDGPCRHVLSRTATAYQRQNKPIHQINHSFVLKEMFLNESPE
ncbi:unnamed protein product [Arctia plantaginis]|uniref:Uncharacterized protein n=1 Tax=Arctia plantaginis TaxID=874455 RepID=A0A8S0ZXV8_ARCPL|nr:unnamed protein product [Arctia plantaginis]